MSLPSSGFGTTDCSLGESEGGAGFGALKLGKAGLGQLNRVERCVYMVFYEFGELHLVWWFFSKEVYKIMNHNCCLCFCQSVTWHVRVELTLENWRIALDLSLNHFLQLDFLTVSKNVACFELRKMLKLARLGRIAWCRNTNYADFFPKQSSDVRDSSMC